MGGSGEEQQQAGLEFTDNFGFQVEGFHISGAILMERNEIQAAKGGGVFVLFADRSPQNIASNMESPLRKFIFRERQVTVSGEHFRKIDADAGGRTESRSGRNLRREKKVYRDIAPKLLQNGERDFKAVAAHLHACNVLPGLNSAKIR